MVETLCGEWIQCGRGGGLQEDDNCWWMDSIFVWKKERKLLQRSVVTGSGKLSCGCRILFMVEKSSF